MTALTTPFAPSSCAQAFAAFGTAVARIGRWLADVWRHRRDAVAIAAFDDRMLADIGLTRCDLNDALSEPLWRDPTIVLAHRYCERRKVRRAVAAEMISRASPSLVPGADTFSLPPRDPPARLML
jgi:uncharacterized protein YjiS (DUF1127 family)